MNFVNGYDRETHEAVLELSSDLADLFEEYSYLPANVTDHPEPVHYLEDEGMEILGDAFGDVIPSLRAAVFEHLLIELTDRGIVYDIEQFKSGTV